MPSGVARTSSPRASIAASTEPTSRKCPASAFGPAMSGPKMARTSARMSAASVLNAPKRRSQWLVKVMTTSSLKSLTVPAGM